VNDCLTEDEARLKANQKLNDVDLDQFMSRYGALIQYIPQLKKRKLHSKIMRVVDDLLEDGMDYNKAVKVAIRKYKHMLENYLDEVIENENEEESNDNEQKEEEGEGEEEED